MMVNARTLRMSVTVLLAVVLAMSGSATFAQTKVKPGFNVFSPEQDIEIGKQSAVEVEKQLPVLNDSGVQNYISRIGERLAAVAPGPKFPYQFKVVNVSDINAFALPGGYMYINRGLIEAARDEGELAGVMAHEMAHVALRHGTNQVSKAYLAQAGLGILGGLAGRGATSDIIGAVGGFGLNSVFLKFSRTAEEQSDVVGAQMLAQAGYDPMAMARMFETLREKSGRDPSKFEQFFSSHPAPANRAARIEQETKLIGRTEVRKPVGAFEDVRSKLSRMPPAKSMQQLAGGGGGQGTGGGGTGTGQEDRGEPVRVSIERPSSRMRTFDQRDKLFTIGYPDNWELKEASNGDGVTIAPRGGVVNQGNQEAIVYGVIVSALDIEAGAKTSSATKRPTLQEATNMLVDQIVQGNQYLQVTSGSERRETIDGSRGMSLILSGRSPVTAQDEQVTLATTWLSDGRLFYTLFITPRAEARTLGPVFSDMLASVRLQ